MEMVYDFKNKNATFIRFFTSAQYISDFKIVDDLLLVLTLKDL